MLLPAEISNTVEIATHFAQMLSQGLAEPGWCPVFVMVLCSAEDHHVYVMANWLSSYRFGVVTSEEDCDAHFTWMDSRGLFRGSNPRLEVSLDWEELDTDYVVTAKHSRECMVTNKANG